MFLTCFPVSTQVKKQGSGQLAMILVYKGVEVFGLTKFDSNLNFGAGQHGSKMLLGSEATVINSGVHIEVLASSRSPLTHSL